jgi:hypothetical protein
MPQRRNRRSPKHAVPDLAAVVVLIDKLEREANRILNDLAGLGVRLLELQRQALELGVSIVEAARDETRDVPPVRESDR